MRHISYILLLNIFWSCCVRGETSKDPKCDTTCTADCTAECPLAKKCADGQQDCGSVENPNPFCPGDRICVAVNCACPTPDSDGNECPEFCNIECSETEIFCDGGRNEKTCKLPDKCVQRGVNPAGDLCPGFCPVTCEDDHIKCTVSNDDNGCEQAPVCEAKGKDSNGADCPGVCSVSCEEENILCAGKVLDTGCTEADTCVFKGRDNDDELCAGTCPKECKEEEILCPECILPDGCKATDQCRTKAKGLTGVYCPATSDSHACPKTCADDEVLCPTFEDAEGCKGEALCVKKAESAVPGVYCPSHSVCHTPCKVNQLACAGGMDENDCKKPDTCIPLPRDINGELCGAHCPGECNANEIQCEGETSEEGCKGSDICVEVGVKLIAPVPEEVGTPCPGYCPIHKCAEGHIKCPSEIEPCFHCKTEEVCRTAAKDTDGVFCADHSASHNCPTYCNENAGEVLCPAYDDEKGCKPKALCMMRTKDNTDTNFCPSHSVCPMTCAHHEMVCPDGDDINGCKNADKCLERGTDTDGNLCPVQCPPVCNADQNLCVGEIMENGCNAASVCVDIVLGNGGGHCRTVCPITCEAGKELVPGGTDANGCPEEGTCKVPKTFSAWANEGDCASNHETLACGPGTQAQKRTCTDGEVDKCAEAEESRTVSCVVAGSELPVCPVGACPSGFTAKCISGACKCYGVLTDKLSWSDARTKCQSYSVEGGDYDLASITTPEINAYISTLITDNTWHGLDDINVEGEWTFVDGTAYNYDHVVTYGWNTGEPNDSNNEDCAYMFTDGNKWNDIACTSTFESVCEGPAYSCSCTDFINENGYGDCGKSDADFGGLVTCYVHEPSSCSDLVVSTTDPHLHQSARACITATNFFAMDGCSTDGSEDSTPQNFDGAESLAEVQCCSKDGKSCVRQNTVTGECWSGDNDDVKVTWFEAYDMCASHGMRLCNSQEELDLCCGSGCMYNYQPLWTNNAAADEHHEETPAETPSL